jgi:hypothetical protein
VSTTLREGDILVTRREEAGVPRLFRYEVGVVGCPPQYTVETYELALNRADSFARNAQVSVWYSEDGQHYRLVTSRRPQES